ncbi:MAG TPA: nuclear transport factor 2 family protein [Rhabdochlamydiaceae bacterium]|nr:nuclear transport factor 2 family protein [Rhabdochlamydiaceae bacterium]
MMSRSVEEIVQDYYTDMQQAFKTGKLNLNKLHLAEDILFLRPDKRFEGKQNVEKMLQELFVPSIKRYQIVHQFHDKTSSCYVIDCITKKSVTIPTVEWLKVKDGKIYEIHHFFDPTLWTMPL